MGSQCFTFHAAKSLLNCIFLPACTASVVAVTAAAAAAAGSMAAGDIQYNNCTCGSSPCRVARWSENVLDLISFWSTIFYFFVIVHLATLDLREHPDMAEVHLQLDQGDTRWTSIGFKGLQTPLMYVQGNLP
jgi:hypothetical protein